MVDKKELIAAIDKEMIKTLNDCALNPNSEGYCVGFLAAMLRVKRILDNQSEVLDK